MVQIEIDYEGDLHCKLIHGPSGSVIATDAPKDNMGKGEAFSPTDLVAAALGSCILTTMAIFAGRHNIPLEKTKASVTKEMVSSPVRRIGRLAVQVSMPAGISPEHQAALERTAHSCPVHRSLSQDIQIEIQFHYQD